MGLVPGQIGFNIVQANVVKSLETRISNLEENENPTTSTANVGVITNLENAYSFDKTNNTLSFSGLTDVYSQLNDFYRNDGLSLKFSGTGSSGIFFNTKSKTLQENYSEGCLLVGAKVSSHIYLNSSAKLKGDTEEKTSVGLPGFISSAAISTFKRLLAWIDTDNCYTIAQITDAHSGGNETYKHTGYLNKLNSLFNFNLLCNSGDIGLDVTATATESTAFELVYNTKLLMDCTSRWIFCKGNHDYNQWMPISVLNNVFNIPAKKRFEQEGYNIDMKSAGYGYIDEGKYNLRIFYLNTSDADSLVYSMSKTQLEWFINSLKSMPVDYKAIILTHQCVDDIGRWNSYPNDTSDVGIKAFKKILKDFVAKTAGSDSLVGISWDFTGLTGKLVCNLCGDSHFDNYIKRDGVNYIVRQGYGYISDSDIPSGGIYEAFDHNFQCCFDVLAIKDNKAKIFRIGIRDSAADIEFTF